MKYKNLFFLFFIFNLCQSQDEISSKIFFKEVYKFINEKQDANSAEKKLLELKKSKNYNSDFDGDFYYILATIQTIKKEYKNALLSSEKAFDFFQKKNDTIKLSSVYYVQGEILNYSNSELEALKKYNLSEKFCKKEKRYIVYNAISGLYNEINDNKNAIFYALKSLELTIKNKDTIQLIGLYNTLGNIYSKDQNFEKSNSYFNQSLKLSKFKGLNYYQYVSYNAIGINFLKKGKIHFAEQSFLKANDYLLKSDFVSYEIGDLYFNLAEVFFKMQRYNKSIDMCEKAMKIANQYNRKLLITKILLLKSYINRNSNNFKSELRLLLEAKNIAEENNFINELEVAFLNLAKCFENSNKNKALEYYKKYISHRENNLLKKQKNSLENIEIKNQINEYKKELQIKNQKVQLLTMVNKNRTIIIVLASLFIIILFLFMYKQYKYIRSKNLIEENLVLINKLKEEKLVAEIEFKKTQIKEFAFQIQEQNNILTQLKIKINSFKKNILDTEVVKKINDVQYLINDTIHLNKEKVELHTEVKKNQDTFIFNLKSKHPDLSEKEIQIITLLRLNFSTKQISNQLNIIEQSVNNYRTKIRKKFGLNKDDSFSKYLDQF